MPLARPVSLDGFLQERRVHSCPVEPPVTDPEPPSPPSAAEQLRSAASASVAAIAAAAADTASTLRGWWQQPPLYWNDPRNSQQPPLYWDDPQNSQNAVASRGSDWEVYAAPAPPVLLLSEALPSPHVGSPEMPTLGSTGHRLGTCKPCAFFHKGGCSNGVQCSFCHLCDAGEKKRRQKDLKLQLRDMRRPGV